MMLEHATFVLQVISTVVAPILTVAIAWITNSLRKTNQRIDTLKEEFNQARLADADKFTELTSSLRAMEATQKAISLSVNRIENYLMSHNK